MLALWRGAAFAAHPLNTEETGTQGTGGWQLELNGERNKDEGVRGAQASMVLSYGVADTVDLQLGLPWQDTGSERGAGDMFAALKWAVLGAGSAERRASRRCERAEGR